jgi:hypothetical protein
MKNNTEKLEETKIEISLRTGLSHRNKSEKAHTQNDYTSYYLGAIFYFMRIALEGESLLEQQTETKAFVTDAQFRENMQFLVQIGEGLVEWMPDYSHAMKDYSNGVKGSVENDTSVLSDASDESDELENLAVQISKVMKNPLIPTRLYNAMSDELTAVIADSDSPEWILGNLKKQSAEE